MTDKKAKAVFFALRPSDFTEMRRAAVALRDHGWETHICYLHPGRLDERTRHIQADAEELIADGGIDGFSFLLNTTEPGSASSETPETAMPLAAWRRLYRRLPAGFRQFIRKEVIRRAARVSMVAHIHQTARVLAVYFANLGKLTSFVGENRPSILVLPEEIVGPLTPLVVRAGHKHGIPSVILPYTIANQDEAFRSLEGHSQYQADYSFNRLCRVFFRSWLRTDRGKCLVRLPLPYVIGQILTRTAPPDPWMMNSGFADRIAIENRSMLAYNLASGLPAGRMEITGAVYDDYLARYLGNRPEERRRLEVEIGIAADRPMLVVAGCPDQSSSCPDGFEYASMADFCEYLCDKLEPMKAQYEVVLRPHPNYPEMGDVFRKRGLSVTMVDTARLIALSDAFIAFASATIRWAVACGVPTINFDAFQYDYDDYKNVGGVTNIRTSAGFEEKLAGFLPGHAAFEEQKRLVRQTAPDWGNLDGQACSRISALMKRLVDGQDGRQ